MPRTPLSAALLATSAAALVAAAASAVPPAAPVKQAPGVSVPRDTPSGARSPNRAKLRKKGSVARGAVRPIAPTPPAGAPATDAPAGGKTTDAAPSKPGTASPDAPEAASLTPPELLARALAIPENADFRAWYEAEPEPQAGRPEFVIVPYGAWSDDDDCITRREGSTKFVRPDCAPRDLRAKLPVDRAAGRAIEEHFGIPVDLLSKLACFQGDGSCEAIENAARARLRDHGILCLADSIQPDHQWILDRSLPEVSNVARGVLREALGESIDAAGTRAQVEALTGFVQAAIPYRTVKGPGDDLVQDGKQRCGLRTPVATLLSGGDCDSKALLLASLIRSVDPNVPVALVYCMDGEQPHMVLAVGCDARQGEQCLRIDGVPHVVIETTSDWDLGFVNPEINLEDVETVRLR